MTEPLPSRSTGSEYAEHVRAVVERAAESEARQAVVRPPSPPALTRGPVLAVLALAFAGVVVWNASAWSQEPEPIARPIQEQALGVSLLAARQMIEDYRERHGRLPLDLAEAGVPGGAFTYRVQGLGQYELFATEGGVAVRHDSEDGAEELLRRLEDLRPIP